MTSSKTTNFIDMMTKYFYRLNDPITMNKLFFILLIIFNSCNKEKELNLVVNNLFQDNMVVQHNSITPIWGSVHPNKRVEIQISWGDKYETISDSSGNWRINIKTPKVDNIPHIIKVQSSNNEILFKNILLGEVWLASGQSNMQWKMRQAENKDELSSPIYNNNEIRMINVDRNLSLKPLSKFSGEWQVCSSETVSDFSAVGYFFAKKLYDELKIPIGIINSSVGGTPAESWANVNNLEKVEGFENLRERLKMSNDPNTDYNRWLEEHLFIDRLEFINKDEIKYVDEKNKIFSQEEFDDTQWESRSIGEISEIFKKRSVNLNLNGPFHNTHNDFDGIVWIRKDFELNEKQINSSIIDIGDFEDSGDFYTIFLNGELIGRKNNWSQSSSKYQIRKGLLNKGSNNLSVRIIDFYGDGGLKDDPNRGLYFQNEKIISFDGSWKSKFVGWLTDENIYILENGFSEIVFPSPLRISRSQGSHTVLNNSMIHPLGNFTVKGVIWYQGEGNRTRPKAYIDVFSSLIDSFREQWKDNDLPFYYVQLAPFADIAYKKRFDAELVAELREAQRLTLNKNNVGMAVIMDIGDSLNIHPLPKKPVGERLALLALKNDYGFKKIVSSGPLLKDVDFKAKEAVISFDYVGNGLYSQDNNLKYFEIAGNDKRFYNAEAFIMGNKVIVKSKKVFKPKYVRYGWKNFLNPNFFNKDGLPASSFSSLKNPFSR